MTTTATVTTPTSEQDFHLSGREVEQFHRDGYLGPLTVYTPREMDELRPRIEQVLETNPPDHKKRIHNRHLDNRTIYDVSTHPQIVQRMASVLGENLLLWRTNFFVKPPGGKEIPWHQDRNFWPLEPEVVISAWIAIDQTTVENSCVQLMPGTHRKVIPHVKATQAMQFPQMAQTDELDLSQKVNMEMKPGEFFLFNERTLHHSEANRSDKRRMGLSVRVIVPLVRVLSKDAPNHGMVEISGRDTMGFNTLTEPPTT